MHIGFSTGALALGDFDSALRMLAGKESNAVELSALRLRELAPLLDALAHLDLAGQFSYVSIHAPTDFDNDEDVVKQLLSVQSRGWNIIVHPDSIRDHAAWAPLNGNLCIENMDSRKRTGRTCEELEHVFAQLPEARLCFDIGHAAQVDPTMLEALRIMTKFGDRLEELHLSEVDTVGIHHRLSLAAQGFRSVLRMIDERVAVIIESPISENEIDDELARARETLAKD